jgi:PKD repeat protein
MGLIQKKNFDFTAKKQDTRLVPDSTVIIKGGTTIVDGSWVKIPNLRVDVKKVVLDFVENSSRRVFNNFNGILYVIIVVDKESNLEVIPSVSFNKRSFGEIKTFPNLSGKIPLMLVRLRQDGSQDLKAIKEIRKEDIEVYKGYGNYTPRGPQGEIGATGIMGSQGPVGIQGYTGYQGIQGIQGYQGITGASLKGITGSQGDVGFSVPTILIERSLIVDFEGTPLQGSEPLTVQFTDLTQGSPIEWYWDFGDGNVSNEQNPSHTYQLDGSYDVTLRVVVSGGEGVETKVSYVNVTDVYFIQDTTDPNEITWIDTVDDEEINIQDSTEI